MSKNEKIVMASTTCTEDGSTKKRKIECTVEEGSIITMLPKDVENDCPFLVDVAKSVLIIYVRDSAYMMHSSRDPTFKDAWDSGLADVAGDIEDDECTIENIGTWELDAKAIKKQYALPLHKCYTHCYLFAEGVAPSTASDLVAAHWLVFHIPIIIEKE